MITEASSQYRLSSPEAGRAILGQLAERFAARKQEPLSFSRIYLDTFDWKLYRAQMSLTAETVNRRTALAVTRDSYQAGVHCPSGDLPAFGRQIPPGKLRDLVAPRSGIRRLLAIVQVALDTESLRILDKRRKTVARVQLQQRSASAAGHRRRELTPLLRVEAVRGYQRQFEAVDRAVREIGDSQICEQRELIEALEAIGRRPGDYSSKIRIDLEADAPAADEVRRILGVLLDTMEANEDGLRRDLDTEFLHDFRVSVRRTRTILGQIKSVIPDEVLMRFKPEFSWLGSLTGPTRDLDVYLLKMDDYRASLPSAVSGDLEQLQEFLQIRRDEELQTVLEGLDSPRFSSLVRGWREFLAQPGAEERPGESVGELAAREIRRAYKRLLKRGRAIEPDTPARALHRLRIDGKKLRYLLEFFRSLHDPDEMEDLIRALKRLQDNLGDFNDYGVQQRMLVQFGEQMAGHDDVPTKTLMAMGRLVEELERGEAAERADFAQRFAEFDSAGNRRRYKKLFKAERSRG